LSQPSLTVPASAVVSPRTLGRAELKLMCYLPLRSQLMSTRAVRPTGPARQRVFRSVPASGRQEFNEAATGRNRFSVCSAHVLRRSRVATVALNEFRPGASWSRGAGIESVGRARSPVAVRARGTGFKRCVGAQHYSGQSLSVRCQVQVGIGLACCTLSFSGASPARPNPSVEPTPNRVAPWPGSGYQVHSPLPGQGATLSGSSHLKR
jgi:hypothetical protein